ncbi:protein translocase subunit SecD [Nocardioides litoris]|uniref:protein translocase subunit SecD n=1 Tax=Nocardioides litoris TaxID=1926648 RepID=UPI0011216CEB|nr:protein translocase subunit SecD [Nocardioides litoris]
MAKKQARPGRTLVVFLLGTAILYGLVALAGSWKPELGLDLQGGTRITLQAQGNPSRDNLEEARSIIDRRVNGSGVSEAEVITQGDNIVVEIPGSQNRNLVEVVQRQAQLRFRLVACRDICQPPTGAQGATDVPGVDEVPSTGAEVPAPPAEEAPSAPAAPSSAPASANRVAPGWARAGTTPSPAPSAGASATATPAPGAPASPSDGASPADGTAPTEGATPTAPADTQDFDTNAVVPLDDAIAFIRGGYTQADVDLFDSYSCNDDGTVTKNPDAAADVPDRPVDDPSKPLVGCEPAAPAVGDIPARAATKYLLSPAVIQGTDLDDAGYQIPQNEVRYVVTLQLGGKGREVFAAASSEGGLVKGENGENFAMVLDGTVLSAPYFSSVIGDGNAQISGNFTEAEARDLSNSLKFGSLPIAFQDPTVETIGPSLAGDQLSAGLVAGAFGLGLVLIYCLLYYRGLGLVVVASLLAAAAVTYALVLLLSETAGFVLTLPGIAGLIIAVGVTADSFIIFFERIRDEMREGKSMRVAVETGWKRAKVTRLAAQVVSLLSAAVLYIFATGVVKGFGFALGLTTIVDLAILFWFTKPMVSWLARFHFFNSGSRWSGLSPETLGIDRAEQSTTEPTKTAVTAGGKA